MINITITTNEGVKKQVNIRKTLSGDYILREHPEIDIFVVPAKQKVLALPKDEQTDSVYSLQERLFDYLSKKGVILPETIIGGNIYGSLQAGYAAQPPGGEDPLQVVIYSIANFIEDEMPKYNFEKSYEDRMEKSLIDPTVQDSTELGEVPQEPFKGSIPKYGFPTRGIYRYNY
jgi:hypothetical protein